MSDDVIMLCYDVFCLVIVLIVIGWLWRTKKSGGILNAKARIDGE